MTAHDWTLVELCAETAGMGWQEWATIAVDAEPGMMKSRAIRKRMRDCIKSFKLEGAPATLDAPEDHPYINGSRFIDGPDLNYIMAEHFRETWAIDCGGHVIRFGYNILNKDNTDPLMIVESKMNDGLHMTFAASNLEVFSSEANPFEICEDESA